MTSADVVMMVQAFATLTVALALIYHIMRGH